MFQRRYFILRFLFFALMTLHNVCAQSFKLDQNLSKMYITGTSNLHNWYADVSSMSGSVNFTSFSDYNITPNKLNLSVNTSGIKGEKVVMNKNIQKTLLADKFNTIEYRFESVTKINVLNVNTFILETIGLLTISGTSKQIVLNLNVEILKNSIHIKGSKELKMTDFNIQPPKALLGMLKTGDTVKVFFDLNYQ